MWFTPISARPRFELHGPELRFFRDSTIGSGARIWARRCWRRWAFFLLRRAVSTSWTGAIWTSRACTRSIRPEPSSSHATDNIDLWRVYSHPADRAIGIICDRRVMLNGFCSAVHYPDHLGRDRKKNRGIGEDIPFPRPFCRAHRRDQCAFLTEMPSRHFALAL